MKANVSRNVLIFLLAFLSFGAVLGGGALILSPGGELLGMPLSNLGSAPFKNFLVPGIILFLVLGIAPALTIYWLLKKPGSTFAENLNVFKDMHFAWSFTIYEAFALIIWLQVEMTFLQSVHWFHTFYIILAILIIFIALLPRVRNRYKK